MMRPGLSEVRSAPALQSGPSSARGPAPFPGLRGCALAAHTPPPATLRASARPELVCLFLFLWTRVLFPPVETVPFTRRSLTGFGLFYCNSRANTEHQGGSAGEKPRKDQIPWTPRQTGP